MSLEQTIADAATQVGLARDEILGLVGIAEAQITRVGDRYDAILANGMATLWVDQENGNDAAEGTQAAPLKSMQTAIGLVPQGGWLDIKLVGNYHISAPVRPGRRAVLITGQTGVKPIITFERFTYGSSTVYRDLMNFRAASDGPIFLSNVRLEIPELGDFHPYALSNTGMFLNDADWGHGNVVISQSEIVIPAEPFCSAFNGTTTWRFISYLNTYPGAITSPAGRLFADQPNTAGVFSRELPWLITNLGAV